MCYPLSCLLQLTVQIRRWPFVCMVNQSKLVQNVFLGRLGSCTCTRIIFPMGCYTCALPTHRYCLLSGVLSDHSLTHNFQCLRLVFTFANGCSSPTLTLAFLPIPQFLPENGCVWKSVRFSSVLIWVSLLSSYFAKLVEKRYPLNFGDMDVTKSVLC